MQRFVQWAGAVAVLVGLGCVAHRRLRREVMLREASEAGLARARLEQDRVEAAFRMSIDSSPNALLVIANDLRISQVTERFASLSGYARSELIGESPLLLLPQRFREPISALLVDFFKDPTPVPTRTDRDSVLLRRDGSELQVEATFNSLVKSDAVHALVTVIDISEQLRTAAALRDSEERFRDLFENASDLIQVVESSGAFAFVNRSWREALGYSQEQARALSIQDVIHSESQAHCDNLFARVMGGEDVGLIAAVFRTRTGDRIELEGSVNLRLRDGVPESTRAIFRDVTQRNRQVAELALAKQQAEAADRVKSAFLATMSHELRTPLNSIIGFTGILKQGLAGPTNEEQDKQLGMVQGSARHLLALINDVLDISKIEAGQLEVAREPFDLAASLKKVLDIVGPMAANKGLALRGDIAPSLGAFRGDARRVEQVLLNLLNNAIKFTQRGEVVLQAERVADRVQMRVVDTGIGVKSEDMALLFQPFRQIDVGLARNHEGSGLGLTICSHLATLMGGEISVQSTWGVGSSFSFSLPASPTETIQA